MVLLEALVGFGLLTLCLLFTFSLFPTAARSNSHARDLSLASTLGHEVLERQRTRAYNAVAAVASQQVSVPTETAGAQAIRTFTYQVDVAEPLAPERLKDVVVTVRWEVEGKERSLRLQTYLAPF